LKTTDVERQLMSGVIRVQRIDASISEW